MRVLIAIEPIKLAKNLMIILGKCPILKRVEENKRNFRFWKTSQQKWQRSSSITNNYAWMMAETTTRTSQRTN